MINSPLVRKARTRYPVGFLGSLALISALSCYRYVVNTPERRNQAMVRAAGTNNINQVRKYLEEGADPNTIMRYLDEPWESQGYSPRALWVRMRGGPDAPHLLNGPTALMRAAEQGNPEMVQLLIDHGADVSKRGWYGFTALDETQDTKIVRMLKRAGAR